MKRTHTQALVELPLAETKERLLLNATGDSWVDSFPLKKELRPSKEQFETLWSLHPEEMGEVKIMGKPVKTPRWQQSYGRPYKFSGVEHQALPVPDAVQPFLDWANSLAYSEKRFNMALVNWYQDGNHYIGPHSDDESQLWQTPSGESLVFSVSLGQERDFVLTPKKNVPGETKRVKMPGNSVVVMGGRCQKTHKHAVPKVAGEKGKRLGRRINLTFRIFK